jgi:glyoxylate reductase
VITSKAICALANYFLQITGRFDQELVSQLPSTLKFLCHNGAGYDQLDIEALTSKGIQASNVPTAVDDSTSTTALWLMIGALRNFALAQSHLASSDFNSKFPYKIAHDPGSKGAKVLGIVGAGGIGRALARKASSAFGMKIVYHNRNRLEGSQEKAMCPQGEPAEYMSTLEELLSRSDVISLHCPLNAQTKGMIGKKQIQMMKKSAVLINTARGPVVNEEELAEALKAGIIAGAGLDVFEKEPSVHPSLLAQSQNGSGKALLLPRESFSHNLCSAFLLT